MDQSVSLMAKEGFALLLDCRDLTTRQIPFDLAASGLELLVVDTRAHHALVDGGYASRRAACESVAKKLNVHSLRDLSFDVLLSSQTQLTDTEFLRARHAVTEMQRVLDAVSALNNKDFSRLGELINSSHASLRDDYEVSCPELDLAVDTAISEGALGARMVGGGFGGSAIALVESKDARSTSRAIENAFAKMSFEAPRFFASLPSQGAHVIQQR
jgi:galactokinase